MFGVLVAGLMLVSLIAPSPSAAATRRPGPPPADLAQRLAKMGPAPRIAVERVRGGVQLAGRHGADDVLAAVPAVA